MATAAQALAETDGVAKRALLLYGLQTVFNNGAYLFGFYVLPQGVMRGSPQARLVDAAFSGVSSFWSEIGMTLLFNVVLMGGLITILNLCRVRGVPVGYVFAAVVLGAFGGLVAGTNSYGASDLTLYNAWEGMALGLSIGGIEMLGYVLVAAATANLTMEEYRSWWRWTGDWQPTRIRRFRDLRLTQAEVLTVAVALILFLAAAFRETVMVAAA